MEIPTKSEQATKSPNRFLQFLEVAQTIWLFALFQYVSL